jgi:antitoxin VapB
VALSIKNKETEALARELARISRKPITAAVHEALERGIARAKIISTAMPKDDGMAERIMAVSRKTAALPDINDMTDDEVLGYDEFGAPTL